MMRRLPPTSTMAAAFLPHGIRNHRLRRGFEERAGGDADHLSTGTDRAPRDWFGLKKRN
jgi:hypothetical protein